MLDALNRLLREEEGATIIEYVLLAALISIVAIGVITTIGTKVNAGYTKVDGALGTFPN